MKRGPFTRCALSLLVALGGSAGALADGQASGAPQNDPCALASRADVGRILGAAVTAGRAPSAFANACDYRSMSGSKAIVTQSRYASAALASSKLHARVAQFSSAIAEPAIAVRGLGDEASAVAGYLYVRKGASAYGFFMSDSSATGAQRRTNLVELAKLVLARAR